MNHNQIIGKWGEQAAVDYLEQKGYALLGRNFRTPFGEIDIIAAHLGLVIFVEVKTRTSRSFGLPENGLTNQKIAHMLACAEYYAAENNLETWQCDAISVEGKPGRDLEIKHFENIAR
jgi:putative endonuclease